MMNNLNLQGRHPKDLPDKETIDDILLELHDTNKFDISWIDLNNKWDWRANGKLFDNLVEKGQVVTCEMDPTFPTFNISRDFFDSIPMSTMRVKETRYDIIRHPIRVLVDFNPDYSTLSKELIDASKETLLRLKDYIGPDVIQDQCQVTGFNIDFMISSCKII